MAEDTGVSGDARAAALIAVIAVAPLAVVVVIALLRGYTIHVTAHRGTKDDDKDR